MLMSLSPVHFHSLIYLLFPLKVNIYLEMIQLIEIMLENPGVKIGQNI